MARDDGGPAFPQTDQSEAINPEGMSLRDWFAGQALGAILPDYDATRALGLIANEEGVDASAKLAVGAYQIADAMLGERAKK